MATMTSATLCYKPKNKDGVFLGTTYFYRTTFGHLLRLMDSLSDKETAKRCFISAFNYLQSITTLEIIQAFDKDEHEYHKAVIFTYHICRQTLFGTPLPLV